MRANRDSRAAYQEVFQALTSSYNSRFSWLDFFSGPDPLQGERLSRLSDDATGILTTTDIPAQTALTQCKLLLSEHLGMIDREQAEGRDRRNCCGCPAGEHERETVLEALDALHNIDQSQQQQTWHTMFTPELLTRANADHTPPSRQLGSIIDHLNSIADLHTSDADKRTIQMALDTDLVSQQPFITIFDHEGHEKAPENDWLKDDDIAYGFGITKANNRVYSTETLEDLGDRGMDDPLTRETLDTQLLSGNDLNIGLLNQLLNCQRIYHLDCLAPHLLNSRDLELISCLHPAYLSRDGIMVINRFRPHELQVDSVWTLNELAETIDSETLQAAITGLAAVQKLDTITELLDESRPSIMFSGL